MSDVGDEREQRLAWIAVLDTSAVIEAKRFIAPQRQWAFFERLKQMVQSGEVCFPRAVRDELRNERHHDTPETWALNAYEYVPNSLEPSMDTVIEVMDLAGEVVEADAEGDPADPYVLAQALEIERSGRNVRVVTEDRTDRLPLKIAMTTACEKLGLDPCDLGSLLDAMGFVHTAR